MFYSSSSRLNLHPLTNDCYANLCQDRGFIGGLVLLLFLGRPLLHLLPVCLLLSVCTFGLKTSHCGVIYVAVHSIDVPLAHPHLEDFDLAGSRVQVLCVFFTLVLLERVDLDAERDTLFSSMLSHGEFCADAVYL